MAAYTSYTVVGAKEDVSKIISNIAPWRTPFQSSIGSESVTQKLFQWQEDTLRAVTANALVDGADATVTDRVPTVMRNNLTQILGETIQIADGLDKTEKYGRAKETAYQMELVAKALKRDLEHAYVGTKQTKVTGNGTDTARKMDGFQAQVDSDLINNLGAAVDISETAVTALQQELYAEGAEPSILQVTPSNAVVVANFANKVVNVQNVAGTENVGGTVRNSRDIGNGTTIVNNIERIKTPFGTLNVLINRFLAAKDSLVYEPDMWKKVTFRPWTRTTLAKTGDSTKIQMLGEFSLKHKNQLASGILRDNTA